MDLLSRSAKQGSIVLPLRDTAPRLHESFGQVSADRAAPEARRLASSAAHPHPPTASADAVAWTG